MPFLRTLRSLPKEPRQLLAFPKTTTPNGKNLLYILSPCLFKGLYRYNVYKYSGIKGVLGVIRGF